MTWSIFMSGRTSSGITAFLHWLCFVPTDHYCHQLDFKHDNVECSQSQSQILYLTAISEINTKFMDWISKWTQNVSDYFLLNYKVNLWKLGMSLLSNHVYRHTNKHTNCTMHIPFFLDVTSYAVYTLHIIKSLRPHPWTQ